MRPNIKKTVISEVAEAATQNNRFTLKGRYSNTDMGEVLRDCVFSLCKASYYTEVYKYNKMDIPFLESIEGLHKNQWKYILVPENMSNEVCEHILLESEGAPLRGSILIEVESDNPDVRKLIQSVYDPGYISNLSAYMSDGALKKAKKIARSSSNRVLILLSQYGIDTFAIFSDEKTVRDLLYFSYDNAILSDQFVSWYCDSRK